MRSKLARDNTYFKERRMPFLCQALPTMIEIWVAHLSKMLVGPDLRKWNFVHKKVGMLGLLRLHEKRTDSGVSG